LNDDRISLHFDIAKGDERMLLASRKEYGPPSVTEPLPASRWQRALGMRLLVTDFAVIVTAVFLAQVIRFGESPLSEELAIKRLTGFSILFAALWLTALAISRSRSPRVIGSGLDEFRYVIAASFWTFGAIAIAALLLKLEIARGYLAVALPVGTIGLLLGRHLWRRHIARARSLGRYQTAVLAIGDRGAVSALARELMRNPDHGYGVVGVGFPQYDHPGDGETLAIGDQRIPVLGDEKQALAAISACGADTVAITDTEHFGVEGIRRLLWELEPMGIDLVVSPGVFDVAGPRLVMRPVSGYPLIHVEKPQYQGAKRFEKRAFDFCFALAALIASSPILIAAAIAVKATSRGPVFYAAERIGLDGKSFTMLKLRTMVEDAEDRLHELVDQNDSEGGVLFKMRNDPRITPVGRVLRRFSIDELPQFLNVLRQEMSVVGPRPPLPREVATYDGEVRRRLLVRPGITGLWQVSGRSDLSWDESVRLDLSYVENWSMVNDSVIVLKTLRAVFARDGAY
jgi:exopolysaccharide biosynthesis polyprenyl glycosylphosphotransferase